MKAIYKAVTSSNIAALAYANGSGYVEFLSGKRFAYDMPRAMFDAMVAPVKPMTVGKYFAKHVKGHCRVTWVGHRCSNSPCPEDATVETVPPAFFACDACKTIPRFARVTFKPVETGHPEPR